MLQLKPIQLCCQCFAHEITSWMTENAGKLNQELIQNIYLELRDIKLDEGKCIVCKHNKISSDSFIKILKLLEKKNTEKSIIEEFIKMFGYSL